MPFRVCARVPCGRSAAAPERGGGGAVCTLGDRRQVGLEGGPAGFCELAGKRGATIDAACRRGVAHCSAGGPGPSLFPRALRAMTLRTRRRARACASWREPRCESLGNLADTNQRARWPPPRAAARGVSLSRVGSSRRGSVCAGLCPCPVGRCVDCVRPAARRSACAVRWLCAPGPRPARPRVDCEYRDNTNRHVS